MFGKQKIWDIQEYNKEKAGFYAAELGISPLVTGVLLERGFNDVDAMRDFLYGSKEPFYNPFLLKGMDATVERVERALANGEQITVYGDYDVDGITASSLLYIYLERRGANVNTYIPKRKSEGYGLNDDALKSIFESGTTLVITVDCGISGLHEVEQAPKGLDIILTDHHTVPVQLPPAYAIINPKQEDCDYPFKDLSGVGVAFKLCQALEQKRTGTDVYWEDLTELAALGTVADIVPLLGENRELVRRGLKAMEHTSLVGLRALITASGCSCENISSENIGFILAPRLNAVGRLEHAQSAVELLVTQDAEKAEAIALELNRENALRQEISRSIMEEAEALLAKEEHIDTAIVLASEGWHQGVVGIVASRLVDKYHLPTILISISDGMAKGSCRSIPALNLYEAIAAESDILTQFGGHHQAAGLTMPADKVEEFKARFRTYVREHLEPEDYLPRQAVDCVLSDHGLITVRDLNELSLLEPFGCSNFTPVFAFKNALLHNHRAIGRDRTHLQLTVDKGDYSYKALMWNKAELLPLLCENMVADIAFMPRINVWNDEVTVQLHAVALRQHWNVCDLRQSVDNKDRLLQGFVRTAEAVAVYVNDKQAYDGYMYAKHMQVLNYGEPTDAALVVLYDLPHLSIRNIFEQLRRDGAATIVLLYNSTDRYNLEKQLALQCPQREQMAVAYKRVMESLAEGVIDKNVLLEQFKEVFSENALLVMEELGFIKVQDGIITKGIIKKSSLDDSPLYRSLQEQREQLISCVLDNLRLSQHELLRI
ncbi:MAG: single-stranded-DNA-specific exonuclease RecJ [Phascolarctobacterium sp.]|nr:single-stranded-DNA-specific exonuclease RecJ [Phascolarctobacterium sp.]